jgi:nicotinate-nucleotide--dimethylbenzimidazole phosphoribosyltransferase
VTNRFERPALPLGFDDSRARDRRTDPAGWRFGDAERTGVWRAIDERRDIRRFRSDPIPEDLVRHLLEAANCAPSVGLMQPWRFIVIRNESTKAAMQGFAARERLVQAEHLSERARHYLDLKIEGIREAPISICVCCDRGEDDDEILGRHTIRDTDLYSTCLAIENLWLAARAEGIGVGWVSFYRPDDVRNLLELPRQVVPVAWLCVGYPDERPGRPGLEAAGWQRRRPLDQFVHAERWGGYLEDAPTSRSVGPNGAGHQALRLPDWWRRMAAKVRSGDPLAAVRVRDLSDELVKPAGSLGVLEQVLERWAMATGSSPETRPRTGILVFAADHGVSARGVSLYPARVSTQVAAAAARGETAVGVLARALDAELVVADVGLRGPRVPGLVDLRVADGSGDITTGPALSEDQLRRAIEAGYAVANKLAGRADVIAIGEIGIGNTTVAAALLAALTGVAPEEVCGRGTGLDAQGVEHKQRMVAAALSANRADRPEGALEYLRRLGGLEFGAMVGAMIAAATARRLIVLDGFATGVAAIATCRLEPSVRDYLVAGHQSAEPAHARVLTELGLEPLLDLRMRLGEASGAALALPLLRLTSELYNGMGRFDQAAVDRPAAAGLNRQADA